MANLLVVPDAATNAGWIDMFPQLIAYAEGRCYRELNLLSTNTIATSDLVSGTRTVTIPATINIVESASVITPAATLPDAGRRNTLRRVSYEFLIFSWPDATDLDVPTWYAMQSDTIAVLAPTPDAAYKVEFTGQTTPAPLSSSNQTTWLTLNVPDLFVAAGAVFGFGYQRDYGQASDDPQAAMSWEATYKTLFNSAAVQEARRNAESAGWQGYPPTPIASPNRS
jgi:hypothetical protein